MGLEENTLCRLKKVSHGRSVSFAKLRSQQIARDTRAIRAAKTKKAYSNASFSSVTAVIESLGFSDNGFKRPIKVFESSNILELGYRAVWVRGGGGGVKWVCLEHYARTLCCNTTGPFQICFLRACLSQHKMEFLSNYLSFRATCVENLKKQLFPECEKSTQEFSHSPTSKDRKRDANIQNMLNSIKSKSMLTSGLSNFLELKQATPEQAHDLLNFQKIGEEAIESFILTNPWSNKHNCSNSSKEALHINTNNRRGELSWLNMREN